MSHPKPKISIKFTKNKDSNTSQVNNNPPTGGFPQEKRDKLNNMKTGSTTSLHAGLPPTENHDISSSNLKFDSSDASEVSEEIRFLSSPPTRVETYGTRAIVKELKKQGIQQGKTNLNREDFKSLKENIEDYYFVEQIKRKTKFSREQFEDLVFVLSFGTPLILLFMYEYFLGSKIAGILWNLASSKTMMLLETFQYVPLIINLRHYKMIGDVDDISYYTHFYFHALSFLFISDTTERVIQLLLCVQLIYLVHLMWKHILYTGQQAMEILRSSVMFVLVIAMIDLALLRFLKLSTLSSIFRGFTLISLQVVRYLPQIKHNTRQRHCAVESVESHLLAICSSAAKVYLGLFDRSIVNVVGYSVSLAANTYLSYQIVLMQENSTAFLEREQILRENLPKEQKLKRQSFSLKFKHGYKRFEVDEEASEDTRTVYSEATQIADRFDHGPMM